MTKLLLGEEISGDKTDASTKPEEEDVTSDGGELMMSWLYVPCSSSIFPQLI